MLQHPIIRILGMFLGAYFFLSLLGKLTPLDKAVVVAAGLFAVVVWMLRYERAKLQLIYFKPYARPVIDIVCKISKEQPPVESEAQGAEAPAKQAGSDTTQSRTATEAGKLLLRVDHDFSTAAYQLKEAIRGHDGNIDLIVEQIRRNARLRNNSSRDSAQSPLGMFLLIGRSGIGKRSLAVQLGHVLYPSAPIALDLGCGEGHILAMLKAARSNPYQVFVVESLQTAPQSFQQGLQVIASGHPLIDPETGGRVSFRECFFFFIIHREAEALANLKEGTRLGTGETLIVNNLRSDIGLDTRLIWLMSGVIPFLTPAKIEQAEIIALMMQKECRKYNLELGRVPPEILAREVQAVSESGGFELAQGRVARRLKQPILEALSGNRGTVNLETKPHPTLTLNGAKG